MDTAPKPMQRAPGITIEESGQLLAELIFLRAQVSRLRAAIERHQRVVDDMGISADLELWSVLSAPEFRSWNEDQC